MYDVFDINDIGDCARCRNFPARGDYCMYGEPGMEVCPSLCGGFDPIPENQNVEEETEEESN